MPRQLPIQFAFRAFHGDSAGAVNLHLDLVRDLNGFISDTRHEFVIG
jgi:hypothetical protein